MHTVQRLFRTTARPCVLDHMSCQLPMHSDIHMQQDPVQGQKHTQFTASQKEITGESLTRATDKEHDAFITTT